MEDTNSENELNYHKLHIIEESYNKNQKIPPSFSNNILHLYLKTHQYEELLALPYLNKNIELFYHKNSLGETPLELIQLLNNKDINDIVPKHEEPPEENTKTVLFNSAKIGDEEQFLNVIQSEYINSFDGCNESVSSCTLLELCCLNGLTKCVKHLLKNNVNVNISLSGRLPIQIAVENQNIEIVKLLIQRCDLEIPEDFLLKVVKYFMSFENCAELIDNYMEILLPKCKDLCKTEDKTILMIDKQDNERKTILHYASICNATKTINTLFEMSANLFRKDSEERNSLHYMTCDQLNNLLTSAVQKKPLNNDNDKNPSYNINFKGLMKCDKCNKCEKCKKCDKNEAELLKHMLEDKKMQPAFAHPAISIYIDLRWRQVQFIYLLPLTFYLAGYLSICLYAFLFAQHNTVSNGLILFSLALMVLQEFLSFMIIYGRNYFMKIDVWVDLIMIGGKIYILVAGWLENKLNSNLVNCVAIILLSSTLGIFLHLRKFRFFTYKVEMFRKILTSFLKYALFYVFPLLGFLLCFYILSDDAVKAFFKTLYDILTMFGGDENGDYPDDKFADNPIFGHVIYVFFIVIIGICLQNLLTGLAIKSMEKVQDKKEIICEKVRAKFIVDLENINSRENNLWLLSWSVKILSVSLAKTFRLVKSDIIMVKKKDDKEMYCKLLDLEVQKYQKKCD